MNNNDDKSDKHNPVPGTYCQADAGSTDECLERALQHHRAGRLMEARTDYSEVLKLQPEHPDALHMMGVLAYQAGKHEQAISLITGAKERMPQNAGVYINLGAALQASGRLQEAVAAFQTAIQLGPDEALPYNNLGNALRLQGELDKSVAAFHRALEIDQNYTEAYVNLAIVFQAQGEMEKAASCYEKAVQLDPGHKSAAHMLAAMRGEATDGAPEEFVEHLFDEYAPRFDRHLVDTLGYSMPGMLRSEIDELKGPGVNFRDAIDLGCGTGLAGVAFRSLCNNLSGVDLSRRMIDQARERNVYDDLRAEDVISALESDQNAYDLFVCADVFPYIGDVEPLFRAVSCHAKNGALFVFSTEKYPGKGFTLHPTGRYAHSQEYLRAIAAVYGFTVLRMRTENLRKHKGEWILGDLVILQYQG